MVLADRKGSMLRAVSVAGGRSRDSVSSQATPQKQVGALVMPAI